MLALFAVLASLALPSVPIPVNVIDGADERGALTELAASLGLSTAEVARIRSVSGHVVCADGQPVTASGALYLTNDQVLTAAHVFSILKATGSPSASSAARRPTLNGSAGARQRERPFRASPPRPGSNNDWAVVRLAQPLSGADPFPVHGGGVSAGDALIVISAQPAGFEHLDPSVPVAQACTVRRAPVSSQATSFYRTDCDASSGSSGGMHLLRRGGDLVFAGMTISTGPSRDPAFAGAPYDEQGGSVTTALGTDAAILAAGRDLAGN